MLIEWTDAAKADALAALEFIAQDNLTAAYSIYEEIGRQVAMLAEHPKLGRAGRVKGTLELVIGRTPYIVAYRIKGEAVQIVRVLHGSRWWPKRFP